MLFRSQWLRVSWPPAQPPDPNRYLLLAALVKLTDYLDRMAAASEKQLSKLGFHRTSIAHSETSGELQNNIEKRYHEVYDLLCTRGQTLTDFAVFRTTSAIDDKGGCWWEYQMISDGDLPPLDAFPDPSLGPHRADDISVFLQAAARVDIRRKLEALKG